MFLDFINLKIYADIVTNSKDITKDDVRLVVYLNDTYVETLKWTEDADQNHKNFYFYCATGSFTLRTPLLEGEEPEGPEKPEQPERPKVPKLSQALKGYQRVTATDFAMIDEVFEHGWNEIHWMGYGLPSDMDLDRTYLDIDVSLCDDPSFNNSIRYLSVDGWQGLQIGISNGELKIYETSTNTFLYATPISKLGIKAGMYFNLKLRVDIKDSDTSKKEKDITLALWVNQEFVPALSGENFAVAPKCVAVGNMLGVYVPNEGKICIKSTKGSGNKGPVATEQPNSNFKEITFGTFDMPDGKYKDIGPELGTQGSYILSLNETVFSGNVRFSKEKGADFRYGGKKNPWNGLCFWTTGDGKLYMQDAEDITAGKTNVYTFHPMYAGVQLVDNTFNLKISTQYVDSDKDGDKDDVKLGVWFDDVLYRNEYIYLENYAEKMGSDCSVYVQPSKAWIYISSDEDVYIGVDFTLFGFTNNWKKEIGIK